MSPNLPFSLTTCQFTYIDCESNLVTLTIEDGESIQICTKSIPSGVGCAVDWVDIGLCNEVSCGCQCWAVQIDESTGTTTTSTTLSCVCYNIFIDYSSTTTTTNVNITTTTTVTPPPPTPPPPGACTNCRYVSITASTIDITATNNFAQIVQFLYTDCNGIPQSEQFGQIITQTTTLCICADQTPKLVYYDAQNNEINATNSSFAITQTPCTFMMLSPETAMPDNCIYTYTDCNGMTMSGTVNSGETIQVCSSSIPTSTECNIGYNVGGNCCVTTSTTGAITTSTTPGPVGTTTTMSSGNLTFTCLGPTCDNAANGSITVNTTATGPFTYTFTQGNETIRATNISSTTWAQGGLKSGTWTFTVQGPLTTETASCTLTKQLVATLSSSQFSLTLNVTGGNPSYYIGSTDSSGNYDNRFFDTNLADGSHSWTLTAGSYYFKIGDKDGCVQSFGPVTLPFTGSISVSRPLNSPMVGYSLPKTAMPDNCIYTYTDCNGMTMSGTVNSGETIQVCSASIPVSLECTLKYTISGECCITTTTLACDCYVLSINYNTTTTTTNINITTTTTVAPPGACTNCRYVSITASTIDITATNNFAQIVQFLYTDCNGIPQSEQFGQIITQTTTLCICADQTPKLVYYDDQNNEINATNSSFAITQTTCTFMMLSPETAMPNDCVYTYTDCNGMTMSGIISSGQTVQVCSATIPQGVDCTLDYILSGGCCVTTSTTGAITTSTTSAISSNYYAIKMNDTNLIIGTPDEDVYINYAVCQGYTIYQMYDQWQVTSLGDSNPADVAKKEQLADFVKKIWDAGLKPVAIVGDGGTLPFDWVKNWETNYLIPRTGTQLWGINYENEFWNGSTTFTNWLSYLTYGKSLNTNWHTSAYMAYGLSSSEANAFLLAKIDVVEATNYTTNNNTSPPYDPPNPAQSMFTSLVGSLNAEAVSMGMMPPYQQFVPLWSAEHPGYFLNNNFSGLYFGNNPPNFAVPLATWISSFDASLYPKMNFIDGFCMFDFNNLQNVLPACLTAPSPLSVPGYFTVNYTMCGGGIGTQTAPYGTEIFICSDTYPTSPDSQLIVVNDGACNTSPNCATTTTTITGSTTTTTIGSTTTTTIGSTTTTTIACLCYGLIANSNSSTTSTTYNPNTTTTTSNVTTTTSSDVITTTTSSNFGTTTTTITTNPDNFQYLALKINPIGSFLGNSAQEDLRINYAKCQGFNIMQLYGMNQVWGNSALPNFIKKIWDAGLYPVAICGSCNGIANAKDFDQNDALPGNTNPGNTTGKYTFWGVNYENEFWHYGNTCQPQPPYSPGCFPDSDPISSFISCLTSVVNDPSVSYWNVSAYIANADTTRVFPHGNPGDPPKWTLTDAIDLINIGLDYFECTNYEPGNLGGPFGTDGRPDPTDFQFLGDVLQLLVNAATSLGKTVNFAPLFSAEIRSTSVPISLPDPNYTYPYYYAGPYLQNYQKFGIPYQNWIGDYSLVSFTNKSSANLVGMTMFVYDDLALAQPYCLTHANLPSPITSSSDRLEVGTCEITITDCQGNQQIQTIPLDEYVQVCSATVPTGSGCDLNITVVGDCSQCFTTTTTLPITTTTTASCGCYSIEIGITTTTTVVCGCYSIEIPITTTTTIIL